MMKNDALFQPESRAKFREILNLGYYDAWRSIYPNKTNWSYWDYGRAFEQNKGLRIDHLWVTTPLLNLASESDIDYEISEANTTYGVIGIKVWIYKGDIIPTPENLLAIKTARIERNEQQGDNAPQATEG